MANKKNYCVIMAGGIGSRFWPMSRKSLPKQFHDILGVGESLLQMTFRRFLKICPPENIYIVTNERYKSLVLSQLTDLREDQVICEPLMRNTAPCVAYANFRIRQRDPNALIVVAPSDHLVTNESEFEEVINLSLSKADVGESLITLGIKPSRPDTGYGYIQFMDIKNSDDDRVKKVKTFTEKPDIDLANKFLDSGDFYWNSGIFIWSLANIQKQFELQLPEMYASFDAATAVYGTAVESEVMKTVYASCENISIDYGIMEKAPDVKVILSDFGWSDLGTWGSLYTHIDLDADQNAIVGQNVILSEAKDNMIYNSSDKLVVLRGLEDFIVVNTPDSLLVIPKEDEQKIKNIVALLRQQHKNNYL